MQTFSAFFFPDFPPQIAQLGNDLRRPFLVTAFCKVFLHRLSSTISHYNHATQPPLYRVFHVPSACTTLQALYAKSTSYNAKSVDSSCIEITNVSTSKQRTPQLELMRKCYLIPSGKLHRAFRALATLGQLPKKSKLATAFRVPTTQLSDVRKL